MEESKLTAIRQHLAKVRLAEGDDYELARQYSKKYYNWPVEKVFCERYMREWVKYESHIPKDYIGD